jgi:hypothetical protein
MNNKSNFVLVAKVVIKKEIEWVLMDKREQPVSFVYALQCEETSRVKIGITQNVRQRLKDIRAMCSTNLRLILCVPAIGQEVELFLHREFDRFRLHGEWFAIPRGRIGRLTGLKMDYDSRIEMDEEDAPPEEFPEEVRISIREYHREQAFQSQEKEDDMSASNFTPKPIKEFWNERPNGPRSYEASIADCYPEHNRI